MNIICVGVAGVTGVAVYDRTCDAVVAYNGSRSDIIKAFAAFSFEKAEAAVALPEQTGRSLNREFEDKLVFTFIRRFFSKLFPAAAAALCRCGLSFPTLYKDGAESLPGGQAFGVGA